MVTQAESYPARLDIDYPEKLDRFSTFFRLIWIIPIAIIASLLSGNFELDRDNCCGLRNRQSGV